MSDTYFSDRERGPRSHTEEAITEAAWGGIWAEINRRVNNGAFGVDYPVLCPDGLGIFGANGVQIKLAIGAEIPDLPDPFNPKTMPPTLAILDLIEFAYRHVAEPIVMNQHKVYGHNHLTFDRDTGQMAFREAINLILARNGLVYELDTDGRVVRRVPPILREALQSVTFDTGDELLDQMLEDARIRFLSPKLKVRKEALEKLWDAWERLKTLEPGGKKQSVTKLLEMASPEENFRKRLNIEANELTGIGNNFLIRHSETDKTPIEQNEHVDYLFHRMFAIIYLIITMRQKNPSPC